MSALEREVAHETTSFKFFDREWSVPTKQRLSHIRATREAFREGTNINLTLAEVFLSPADFEALCEINPDVDEFDKFGDEIAKALGFKSSGNSASSASSS